jgi:Ca-activated chloride channel family protein
MGAYVQNTDEVPKGLERDSGAKASAESRSLQGSRERQKGYRIGVNVDLVLMYASVFDKNGRFVSGLDQNKFKIYEDGIEQNIVSFSQEDVPVSLGIVLDLSGSMRSKIERVNGAALAFIQASNPQDQVFLIGFNEEVELLQDFTGDIDEITDALQNTVAMGGTALYDAIYLGVQKAQTGTKSKKAIVIISDGEDRNSSYTLDELVSKVQESDVAVFCVGFLNSVSEKSIFGRWSKSASEKVHDALKRISDETGGKAFFPGDVADIHSIVSEIAGELRNQYSIGYYSSNIARDGSWRRVTIRLDKSIASINRARHRRGYFAPKEVGSAQ